MRKRTCENHERLIKALNQELDDCYDDLREQDKEIEKLNNIIERLNNIIDKAIEYIGKTDTFQIVHSIDGYWEKLRNKTKKDLLDILKGVDKK